MWKTRITETRCWRDYIGVTESTIRKSQVNSTGKSVEEEPMEELVLEECTDEPAAVEPTAEQMEEGSRVVSSGRSRGKTNRGGAGRGKDPVSDK